MKYFKILFVFVLTILMGIACNRDEIFEREQYKHVVALMSEGYFNVFSEEHVFTDDLSTGYLAASCGGSLPIAEPAVINLLEDSLLLLKYNTVNFDMNANQYAHYLPSNRYIIDEHRIDIPSGERYGKMKIQIRTEGLSPDSIYFIPFRVEQSNYEVNPNKYTVLYRVHFKNTFATTRSITEYQHRGVLTDIDANVNIHTMMSKAVFPVSNNAVRIFVGNKFFENNLLTINKWAIRLTVSDNGSITISPWDFSYHGIKVRQVDGNPDYPNIYKITDDGYKKYKTFLLCYEYDAPDNGITYRMQEELRLEYIDEVNR